jgi:hypothetical protein
VVIAIDCTGRSSAAPVYVAAVAVIRIEEWTGRVVQASGKSPAKDIHVTRTAIRTALLLVGACYPLLGAAQTASADRASVEAFFAKYQKLGTTFDMKLADLYSDQAAIYPASLSKDGLTVKSMRLTGVQWKALLARALPLAKQVNDRDTYSNVRVSTEGAKAKIEADRYSNLKCYTDKHYSMRVERQSDGSYLIIEERMRMHEKSSC